MRLLSLRIFATQTPLCRLTHPTLFTNFPPINLFSKQTLFTKQHARIDAITSAHALYECRHYAGAMPRTPLSTKALLLLDILCYVASCAGAVRTVVSSFTPAAAIFTGAEEESERVSC